MIKFRKNFKVFVVYLMVIYPLIFQVFLNNPLPALVNQTILFVLILLTIYSNSRQVLNFFITKKLNISSLFLLTFFYLNISLFFFVAFNGLINFSSILRELIYSIIPILFYFVGKGFNNSDQIVFFRYLFFCLSFVVFIGVIYRLDLFLPDFLKQVFEQRTFKFNFASYYTPIIMSFLAQLTFALLLFNKIKIKYNYIFTIIFFIISILTLQRAAFLGIIVSLTLYVISFLSFSKIFFRFFIIVLGSSILYANIYSKINNENESMFFSSKFFVDEIEGFTISGVQSTREKQAIITNNENIFNLFFGEGFSKYSPTNELAKLTMPDASYFRIFNELGVFGLIIFFSPFVLLFFKAVGHRDFFMIYFLLFSLTAFYFNRVLWTIPINYLFYITLGTFSNFNNKINA